MLYSLQSPLSSPLMQSQWPNKLGNVLHGFASHFCQAPTNTTTTYQCYNNNYLYSLQMNVRYSLLYKLLKETRRSHYDMLQQSIVLIEQH